MTKREREAFEALRDGVKAALRCKLVDMADDKIAELEAALAKAEALELDGRNDE